MVDTFNDGNRVGPPIALPRQEESTSAIDPRFVGEIFPHVRANTNWEVQQRATERMRRNNTVA